MYRKCIDRTVLLLITFVMVMLCGCNVSVNTNLAKASAEEEREEEPSNEEPDLIEGEYPIYFSFDDKDSSIKLYFTDDDREIPYIDIETAGDILEKAYHEADRDNGYDIDISYDGDVAILTRENEYQAFIDSKRDLISFPDYDAFLTPSWSKNLIDTLEHYGTIEYQQIDDDRSFSRHGAATDIDLAKYGIDILEANGKCYIPLQTFSDVFLSLQCYTYLIYNREAVYANELTIALSKDFISKSFSATTGKRSSELANFTYNELCLALDHFYGLKEMHGIEEFDTYFAETGLKERLLSEDPEESENAVAEFLRVYINDLHSDFFQNSYHTGVDFKVTAKYGPSYDVLSKAYRRFGDARKLKYPDGVPGYEEIGDTAFIAFDRFDTLKSDTDYYNDPPTADTKDTVGILLYSFKQITRDDSPIKNVVLDLSHNVGGDQTTTAFAVSMILGGASMTVDDSLTGAYTYETFKTDANLDGVFDEKDSLAGYDLYCLTSPVTLSCANWAANEMKRTQNVTLIGQKTGGTTSIVLPLSLADGTTIQISSNRRLSVFKNGVLCDIDEGIEPDIYIAKESDFYEREALAELIGSGFYRAFEK